MRGSTSMSSAKIKLCVATALTGAMLATAMPAYASTVLKEEYEDLEVKEFYGFDATDLAGAGTVEASGPLGGAVTHSFQGLSQYDVGAVGRGFIPPDTMGAIGTTQYMEFVNGGVGVFDKATGARTLFQSDVQWWAAAGQTGVNGDSRVLFDAQSSRWIAIAFANSVANIQIAVSATADALGPWQSTQFVGFAGGTADYPTLAMDTNAIYIGTNNFNSAGNFRGTTLNVLPLASLVGGGAPTTAGLVQFNTPYNPAASDNEDRGFAIQGVNSTAPGTTGKVEAVSLFDADIVRYDINNAGTPGATRTAVTHLGTPGYDGNGAGRQPNQVPDVDINTTDSITSNDRVVDTLDDRIGSSVWEVNGRIYSVHTVTPTGGAFTVVRYDVVDANTNAILFEGQIGDATHDYYQGSLAVNRSGQVVIGYNRSGRSATDGVITFAAQGFNTLADGSLVQTLAEQVLKTSLVDDYHNNSTVTINGVPTTCGLDGQVACGRQRWGDYSSVTIDPLNNQSFWLVGEYAREYNNAAGGHPGGTGGSRWGTWIAEVQLAAVPEPSSWAMMIGGFGFVGGAMRRSVNKVAFA